MSWEINQGNDSWEFILNPSSDFQQSYCVFNMSGGAKRLSDLHGDLRLQSVNYIPRHYSFQRILITPKLNQIVFVDWSKDLDPREHNEFGIILPKIPFQKFVEYVKSLPITDSENGIDEDGSTIENSLIEASYNHSIIDRNHAKIVSHHLPGNIQTLIANFTAPKIGGEKKRRKTIRKRSQA